MRSEAAQDCKISPQGEILSAKQKFSRHQAKFSPRQRKFSQPPFRGLIFLRFSLFSQKIDDM